MVLPDTDHISLIARGGSEGERILKPLSALRPTEVAVSIISYEEQMRGWLAEIAAARTVDRQETKYHELGRPVEVRAKSAQTRRYRKGLKHFPARLPM